MKKLVYLAALAIAVVSCGKKEWTLTATFDSPEYDGKMAYLVNYETSDTVDSVEVKNKCLEMKGEADTAYMARLIVDGIRMMFVVENGEMAVTWQDRIATGTPLNERFNAVGDSMKGIEKAAAAIDEQLKAGKITEPEATEKMTQMEADYMTMLENTLKNNMDNPIGVWAFVQYANEKELELDEVNSLLANAPERLKKSGKVQQVINFAAQKQKTAVGQKFTDFSVKQDDGKDVKLSDYVGKGKYVLVDFWASWCGPCRKEMANLKEIYKKYHDKGLDIVGVAVWDKPADTRAAMKQLELPWPVIVNGQTQPTDIYGISGIPHIIIFGPDGTILSRGLQDGALMQRVDELVGKK